MNWKCDSFFKSPCHNKVEILGRSILEFPKMLHTMILPFEKGAFDTIFMPQLSLVAENKGIAKIATKTSQNERLAEF